MSNLFHKLRTPVEIETQRRILIAVYSYAYEYEFDPIIEDHDFDRYALMINPTISTGKPQLDEFFRTVYHPSTGSWIGSHPELEGIRKIYNNHFKGRNRSEARYVRHRNTWSQTRLRNPFDWRDDL